MWAYQVHTQAVAHWLQVKHLACSTNAVGQYVAVPSEVFAVLPVLLMEALFAGHAKHADGDLFARHQLGIACR